MNAAASVLLLALAGCTACAMHSADIFPITPTVPSSMSLIGRYGFAHACPVEKRVVTAAHVVETVAPDGTPRPYAYVYQQGSKSGELIPAWSSPTRDLGSFDLVSGDTPDWQKLSLVTPSVGDSIYWYEFQYSKSVRTVRRAGTVTGINVGQIIFEPSPTEGASGSCLLNSANEVVGIVTWSVLKNFADDDPDAEWQGIGPLLTGKWTTW